jgi:hypothetical protein
VQAFLDHLVREQRTARMDGASEVCAFQRAIAAYDKLIY